MVEHNYSPRHGDRVVYVDGDGNERPAIVVDPVLGDEYVTLVCGANREFDEGYVHSVTEETSVFPHEEYVEYFADDIQTPSTTYAYYPEDWAN